MRHETKLTLATIGIIIFSAAIVAFLIFNKSEPGDKNPVSESNLSANISDLSKLSLSGSQTAHNTPMIDISTPAQYAQPLIVSVLNNTLSITPVNAKNNPAPEPIGQNTIRYNEAYANTDVVHTKQATRLKEDIILKAAGHPDRFEYWIDLSKYDFTKDINGNIYFYIKGKKEDGLFNLFTIPAPFMSDSKGFRSSTSDVKTTLSNQGILTIEPNKKWLDQAVYPVTIDPTIEINILNVYSHPQQGENWEVSFTTQGQADLKIIPNDQATIDDDEFVSLSCNDQNLQPQILTEDIIYYPNWQCNDIGKVIHYTKKAGNHTLRFEFGDAVAFAYNEVSSVSVSLKPGVVFKRGVVFNKSGEKTAAAAPAPIDLTLEYSTVGLDWHTNTVITKPTNTADGDFLLAGLYISDSTSPVTPPDGWTLILSETINDSTSALKIYYKRASSEGASWTWTHLENKTNGWVKRITGVVASGDPEDCTRSVKNDDYHNPVTWTTITTATNGAAVLGIFADDGEGTMSGSTLTERIDTPNIYLTGDIQTSAGASGNKEATASAQSPYAAVLIALKPQ